MEQTPLQTFEATLRSAAEEIKENSREAAITALRGTIDFINSVPNFESDNLALTLTQLMAALHDLDSGRVLPMVTPAQIDNRPREASFRKVIRAAAIFMVELLVDRGLPLDEACKFVAPILEQGGVSVGGRIETPAWKTIKGWRYDHTKLHADDQERRTLSELKSTFRLPNDVSLDQIKEELPALFSRLHRGLG